MNLSSLSLCLTAAIQIAVIACHLAIVNPDRNPFASADENANQ
jgi:hypothetical protein